MSPKGYVAKLIAQRGQWVFLVQGKADNGHAAFWYVTIDPQKLQAFRKALERSPLRLGEYGKVIASGWGEEPSDDVIHLMKERFGFG